MLSGADGVKMSNGPAKETRLGDLHNKVAEVMIKALDQVQIAQDKYEAGNVDTELIDSPPEVAPALLSVMVKFLDSNKITCAPEAGNQMSELEKKLAEKKTRRVGNVVHLVQDD